MPARRSTVPAIRVRPVNGAPVRGGGEYVLYWMIAARRTRSSFALQRAAEWCRELGRPLAVLEAVGAGYPWASDRLHRFALDGMADNAKRFAAAGVRHHAYVEPEPGAGSGLLTALAERACVVVTDGLPGSFLARMVEAAVGALPLRMEAVDSNGLIPVRAAEKAYTAAVHFRRFAQRVLPEHLDAFPADDPLEGLASLGRADLPAVVGERWAAASPVLLHGEASALAALAIDHSVPPVALRGGPEEGAKVLRAFLRRRLARYADGRNEPEADATSGLSPYLHWGFVSTHQVFSALTSRVGWTPERMGLKPTGAREGWWGMDPPAEAFLDQLVIWRELAFNTALLVDGHDRYESLPAWARASLDRHADDPRLPLPLERLEEGRTPDALWNAAQGQLRREGRIHGYLRMIWGKRFLEWTRSPREAMEWMLRLNDRWALDGRDPSSVAGIAWTLGRYDRPWGPERPIFGTVRYMSSANAARKVRVKGYVGRYAPHGSVPYDEDEGEQTRLV